MKIIAAVFESSKMHLYDVETAGKHPVHLIEGGEYITEDERIFDECSDMGWFYINQKEYDYFKSQCREIDVPYTAKMQSKAMTNREWLNSLTDEELMHWLYDERSEIVEWRDSIGDYYDKNGEKTNVQIPVFDKLYPRFHEIGRGWTSSSGRFMQWIKEERREGVYIE